MKKIIMLAAVAVVGFMGVRYLQSKGNDLPKIVEDSGHFNAYSNVDVDGYTIGMIYEHCKKCSQGVYLDHKQEGIRCTYCGEKKVGG